MRHVFLSNIFSNKSYTLPYAHRKNISRLALNPRGNLLLSIDDEGHAILSHFPRRIVLHHFSLKGVVSALAFSPCGHYFAVGQGRLVEVWHTPATPESTSEQGLEFAPFVRHHLHAGHHDTVQSVEWSGDSRFFLTSSKDLTARIWSLTPEDGFVPTTLAGHRESLLGAWFSSDQEAVSNLMGCCYCGLLSSSIDLHRKSRWCSISLAICGETTDQWRYGYGPRRPIVTAVENYSETLLHAEQRQNEMCSLSSKL